MLDLYHELSHSLLSRQVLDNSTGVLYVVDPPPGQVRYTGDSRPNIHGRLIATGVATTAVAFLAVSLRLFTRIYITKSGLAVDDYMVIIAMAFSFALLGMNFQHQAMGLGFHMWDIPLDDYMVPFQVYTLAGTMVYSLSLAFSKISILFLYLRLSTVRWFRILVWMLLGIVVSYAIIYNLMSVFGCKPIAATWDLSLLATAKCLDQLTKYMALSILNIIIDVLELILPIPIVVPLQMSNKQKISVCLVFATGIFVCAVAIKRTMLLPALLKSPDYTWDAVEQFQWCFAEVNAGIACASVPALKSFFTRYLPGFINSRLRSNDRSKNTGPYDTIEKGDSKPRSKKEPDIYEMTILDVDDNSEKASTRQENDDEARLWNGKPKGVTAPTSAFSAMAKPGTPVQPPNASARLSSGSQIRVTTDTRVEYGNEMAR